MHRSAIAALLAGLLGVAPPPPSAAGPLAEDAAFGEIEVRLVEVEVLVTDKSGRPITGLGRDDFELSEDGETVLVTHFEAAVSGPSEAADRDRPLQLAVCVDRAYLRPGDLGKVRPHLARFLRRTLRPGDRALLAVTDRQLDVRQGFTSVPELVVAELARIEEPPGGNQLEQQYQDILREIRRSRVFAEEELKLNSDVRAKALLSQVQAFAAEAYGRVASSTAQLQQLIQTLAGLPGRRVVLYVGGRPPVFDSRALFDAWQASYGRAAIRSLPQESVDGRLGVAAGNTPDLGGGVVPGGAELLPEELVRDAAGFANAHGVTFHTLEVNEGRRFAGLLAASGDSSQRLEAEGLVATQTSTLQALSPLAQLTGGRVSHRKLERWFEEVSGDLASTYVLGFVPSSQADGKARRLEVKLRPPQKKLRLRHRRSYVHKSRDQEMAERAVSALLLGVADNPLDLEISAEAPRPTDEKGLSVPVKIRIPLARLALVAEGRAHTGRLSIFIAAGGLEHGIGTVEKRVVPVRIPNRDLLTALGQKVEYSLELALSEGPERIAVTVRDDFRPATSTATAVPGVDFSRSVGFPDDASASGAPAGE